MLNNGYDADGNLTEFENSAPISYNGDDQNTAFGFDGNGNPTSYKGTSLSFDPLDRMTDYGPQSSPTLAASYKADGLRAMKQASGYSPVYTLYNGDDPIVEMSASGGISAINTFGAYGLVSHHTGGVTTFYEFDPQGSVAHRLDVNTNVVSSDLYDAWGNPASGLNHVGPYEPFGYGAEEGYTSDWNTGLALLGHRYYDPGQGRFLNRDPIGYAGGLNLYGYVDDDPVTGSDPSGELDTSLDSPGTPSLLKELNMDPPESPFGDPVKAASNNARRLLAKIGASAVAIGTGVIRFFSRHHDNHPRQPQAGGAGRRGGGRGRGPINWSWKSGPTFGHTFLEHGQGSKNFTALRGRAGGTGTPQGQWLNNEAVADFLKGLSGQGCQGTPIDVSIPTGLGQVILPNGTTVPATRARIIPNGKGGFQSAFPILP